MKCNFYQNSHDPSLKILIDGLAQQLIAAQLDDDYLGTYSLDRHWTSWDVWSHKYDLIGLLSYYQMSGYKPALAASEKIGDLLCTTFGSQPGQMNTLKAGPHVGMAATCILDPMTDLYRFTGNKKFLDFCFYLTKSYNNPGGPRIISTWIRSAGLIRLPMQKLMRCSQIYWDLSNCTGLPLMNNI